LTSGQLRTPRGSADLRTSVLQEERGLTAGTAALRAQPEQSDASPVRSVRERDARDETEEEVGALLVERHVAELVEDPEVGGSRGRSARAARASSTAGSARGIGRARKSSCASPRWTCNRSVSSSLRSAGVNLNDPISTALLVAEALDRAECTTRSSRKARGWRSHRAYDGA